MRIFYNQITTPVGNMLIGSSNKGLCFAEFVDDDKQAHMLERLSRDLGAEIVAGDHVYLDQTEMELQAYFEKQGTEFTVPLHLIGSDFQQSVWQSLLQIPYGKTWTYKQQAIFLNNLPAIRAVAATNGANRHAIIIPCHRVVGSNGSLTGYAGGLQRKAWLLKLEMDKTGHSLEIPFE